MNLEKFNSERDIKMKMLSIMVSVLVLSVCVTANANLSLDISGTVEVIQGSTLTITVSSDSSAQQGYSGYVIIEEGWDGELSNGIKLSSAGNLGSIVPYSEDDWGVGYEMVAGSNQDDLVAGSQFTVDWDTSGLSVGDTAFVSLWLDPDYDTPQATATLTVVPVPEPMTIALFGLGGLLLRHRK